MVFIRLFGGFSITLKGGLRGDRIPGKLRDLFCYLLINHDHTLQRELVASALWENTTTVQSKKYLRTALWQLHKILAASFDVGNALQVDSLVVRLNTGSQLWLDLAELERTYDLASRSTVRDLVERMKTAVDLYSGDLLPGNYYEWCLHERERLKEMYLALLDKLLADCEVGCDCNGLHHRGALLLHYNPFNEHIYQRLMRSYYFLGDRGTALTLYEQCANTLQTHLRVKPSDATVELCQQIRSGTLTARNISLVPTSKRPPLVRSHTSRIADGGTGKTDPWRSSNRQSHPSPHGMRPTRPRKIS